MIGVVPVLSSVSERLAVDPMFTWPNASPSGVICICDCAPVPVSAYQQIDLSGGMDFAHTGVSKWLGKAELKVGVDNVFNRMPPVASNAFPATNADVGDYNGPIGRLYYIEARYRY